MSILRDINNELSKETIYSIIKDLIRDEEEAIEGYEYAIKRLSSCDIKYNEYKKAEEVFNHIIGEEKEHIEELENLL